MPKATKTYMVRRGRKYLIERKLDGTFGKFIPVVKSEDKKDSKGKQGANPKSEAS
jgi:hypothetical protein